MATIAQQLTELVNQKNALAANLNTKGVTASTDETLNTLVPKVLDIQTGGSADNKLGQLVDRSLTTISATDLGNITEIADYVFYYNSSLQQIEIPNSVTSIGRYAFAGCSSLQQIIIPSSVTTIGEYCFNRCNSSLFQTITIPANINSIGSNAFYSCSNLTTVNFDENINIDRINSYVFADTNIVSIIIPSSVTSLESSAFYNCKNLESILLPENLTVISSRVFSGCSKLSSILLPSSLASIGNSAFNNTGLTSIIIPSNVSMIYVGAFQNCSELTTMRVERTTPPNLLGTNAISPATTQIQVPMASVEAYKTATNWSNFADIIVGYEEETT